jgi:hypothetical protein
MGFYRDFRNWFWVAEAFRPSIGYAIRRSGALPIAKSPSRQSRRIGEPESQR